MKRYKFDFAAGSNHSSSIRHQSKIVSPLSSKLVRLFNTSGLFVLHMLAFQVSAPSSNQIIWLMISLFQLCIKCLLNLSLGQDQDTRTIFSLISVEGIEWIASYFRMKPQIVRCVMLAFICIIMFSLALRTERGYHVHRKIFQNPLAIWSGCSSMSSYTCEEGQAYNVCSDDVLPRNHLRQPT